MNMFRAEKNKIIVITLKLYGKVDESKTLNKNYTITQIKTITLEGGS